MADLIQFALDQLPKSLRGAYSALRSFAAKDTPVSTVISDLRNGGYSFRTQTLTDVYASIRGRASTDQFIRSFGPDAPIPNALHKAADLSFHQGATHQYLVGTNSTNELIPEAIYVNSDRPLSENEIFSQAADAFRYEEGTGLDINSLPDVTFTVDDARIMPGQPF